MTAREKQINVRVETTLLAKIDKHLEQLQKEKPSQVWTRSSAVRQALYEYYEEEEPCSDAQNAEK